MRRYGAKQPSDAAVIVQLKTELASISDQRLAALTVADLSSRYRADRRLIECTLLAAQASRRRFLATGEVSA